MLHSFCEFSAVIQLAATFNLGCIALSGQKSFARSLANYFFRVENYMNVEFRRIKELISTDKSSFENIIPQTIQGKDYEEEIKYLKKEFENLETETNQVLDYINKEIDANYTPKYLDSICIILGLYSLFELIMSVFIKIGKEDYILSFCALNIITILFVTTCVIAEGINYFLFFSRRSPMVFNFYMQGKNAVLISVSSLFFAWIFPCVNQLFRPQIDYTDSIGRFHFYIGLLLPFAGFFIYWIYIQVLSRRAKNFIREKFSPSMRKFQGLHDRRNEIDTILTEFSIDNIQFENNEED